MSTGVIVNTYGPDVSQMNWNCAECITNCAKCIHNSAHQWEMALLWIHMALMYVKCTTIQPFLLHTREPINEKWLECEYVWPLCILIVQQYSHFSFILQSPSMRNGCIMNTYGPYVPKKISQIVPYVSIIAPMNEKWHKCEYIWPLYIRNVPQ